MASIHHTGGVQAHSKNTHQYEHLVYYYTLSVCVCWVGHQMGS